MVKHVDADEATAYGCGIMIGWLVSLVVSFVICGFCFDYSLMFYFGKDISFWGDGIAGMLCSPILLPVTVIAFVLSCCGVVPPLIK